MRLVGTKRRRKAVGIVSIIAALVAVASAFAWYAGYASTSASASAGHAPLTVALSVGSINGGNPLYPGDAGDVPITVTNTGTHRAHVGSVALTSVTNSNEPDCLDSWFEMEGVTVGQTLDAGASVVVHGSLAFTDLDLDQGACSDATLTLGLETQPNP